jgi:hypothetical protein
MVIDVLWIAVTYLLVAKIALRACQRLNASVGDEEYCDWAAA